MTHLTPIKVTAYGHTLSRYDAGTYQGYAVTAKIDGKEFIYDFQDSYELAIEYRDILERAYEAWAHAAELAEMATIDVEARWSAVGILRGNYEFLITNAQFPKWNSLEGLRQYEAADYFGAMHP